MPRRWRGVLATEGEQTGDGRIFPEGVFTWVDPPLPLAWMRDGDQHVNMSEVGPQVGVIESLARDGVEIASDGMVDDGQDDGAEVIRRLESGTAPLGSRFGVSLDMDDLQIEFVDPEGGEDDEPEVIIVASGADHAGIVRHLLIQRAVALTASANASSDASRGIDRALAACAGRRVDQLLVLVAAAGDDDPTDGEVVWTQAVDDLVMRYTRARIRGATLLSVGAMDGAWIELDPGDEGDATADAEPEAVAAGGAPALLRGLVGRDDPPGELLEYRLEEPNGSLNIDQEATSGYLALWETCHTGYLDRCVPPPREVDYDPFHHGTVETEAGDLVAVGNFTWGIPHADLSLAQLEAFVHYADSRHRFARARLFANEHGIWHTGCLRAGITADDVRDLRSLSMSGDWRYDPRTAGLRAIAALAVNYPGYPVPRRSALVASAGGEMAELPTEFVYERNGRVLSMVASGIVAPAAAGGCSCGGGHGLGGGDLASRLDAIERRMAAPLRADLDQARTDVARRRLSRA